MLFSSLLRNCKRPATPVRRRTQKSPSQWASFRPRLEALEDRWQPSGLPYPIASTVSELVANIDYANNSGGAFTINLNPSNAFELSTYLPVVGGGSKAVDLTINGNGGTIERVSSQSHNLVSVAAGASLTLDDVTLQNGYVASGSGGAIYNRGTLTIRDSTLSGNRVSGRAGGGAIANDGTLTVIGSTFTANYADGGHGGAISNGGVVTVSDSRFFGNWVSPGYTAGGKGGGIYNYSTGTLIVRDSSSIEGNYATWFDQGSHSSDVHNDGVVYQDNTSTIGAIGPNPAIMHDSNAPQLWIHDVNVVEGNTGTTSATFTLILTAAGTQPVSVAYSTGAGTATSGIDYQTASGTLTFAPGEASKTITVPISGDRVGEPDETFNVSLSDETNATMGDAQGIGTILDDEPRISIDDVTRTEGSNGTTYFTFTVTLSVRSTTPNWSPNTYDQTVTVSFRTQDGTATTGNRDYSGKSGTLRFRPGERTKTITVAVKGDSTQEAEEYFYLDLFDNSSNSLFTRNRGTGTILNDD